MAAEFCDMIVRSNWGQCASRTLAQSGILGTFQNLKTCLGWSRGVRVAMSEHPSMFHTPPVNWTLFTAGFHGCELEFDRDRKQVH